MKIEMGESLIYSWLRHIEKCQIVQLNWKMSDSWGRSADDTNTLYQEMKNTFGNEIFNKTDFKQVIKQAEIDAFSVSFSPEETKIYAVDIAYHEAGLNYGSKEESENRIIKKILRSILCLQTIGIKNADIIFASPKINKNILIPLNEQIKKIISFLKKNKITYNIKVISNENFKSDIVDSVLHEVKNISDTSELFMRSMQLYGMFYPLENREPETAPDRIGKFAQKAFKKLIDENCINEVMIKNLKDIEYCKKYLQVASNECPILRDCSEGRSDSKKRPRYYADDYVIGDEKFYLTSQWFIKQENALRQWLYSNFQEHIAKELFPRYKSH